MQVPELGLEPRLQASLMFPGLKCLDRHALSSTSGHVLICHGSIQSKHSSDVSSSHLPSIHPPFSTSLGFPPRNHPVTTCSPYSSSGMNLVTCLPYPQSPTLSPNPRAQDLGLAKQNMPIDGHVTRASPLRIPHHIGSNYVQREAFFSWIAFLWPQKVSQEPTL